MTYVHLDSLVEFMSLTESKMRFAGMVAVIYLTTLYEQEVAVLLLLHHLYRHRRHFRQRRLKALVGVQVVLQVFRTEQTCTEAVLVEYLQELLYLRDYLGMISKANHFYEHTVGLTFSINTTSSLGRELLTIGPLFRH